MNVKLSHIIQSSPLARPSEVTVATKREVLSSAARHGNIDPELAPEFVQSTMEEDDEEVTSQTKIAPAQADDKIPPTAVVPMYPWEANEKLYRCTGGLTSRLVAVSLEILS